MDARWDLVAFVYFHFVKPHEFAAFFLSLVLEFLISLKAMLDNNLTPPLLSYFNLKMFRKNLVYVKYPI
jgi:hypothetical protein